MMSKDRAIGLWSNRERREPTVRILIHGQPPVFQIQQMRSQ